MEAAKSFQFALLPTEIVNRVFSFLSLRDRISASQVCVRWNDVLLSSSCQVEGVAVLNIFEGSVWRESVQRNTGTRVQAFTAHSRQQFASICTHLNKSKSVKLWYHNEDFAKNCLDVLSEQNVRMNCIDIYPYSGVFIVDEVYETFPKLTSLVIRPHGTAHFTTGAPLSFIPKFEYLTTLVLESVTLDESVVLPPTLTTFEFSHRRFSSLKALLRLIAPLDKLEYFSLSHIELNSMKEFVDYLQSEECHLKYMIFKFCRFGKVEDLEAGPTPLETLKFDLCTAPDLELCARRLIELSPKLKVFSWHTTSDVPSIKTAHLLFNMLQQRQIKFCFGLLQNDICKDRQADNENDMQPPSAYFDVLSRFDASFVDNSARLASLLVCHLAPYCYELKFVQCKGLTDEILAIFAQKYPNVRKLSLYNCVNVTTSGIKHFVNTTARLSKSLEIIWKSSDGVKLLHNELLNEPDVQSELSCHILSDTHEEVLRLNITKRNAKFLVRDFTDDEKYLYMGVVVSKEALEDLPSISGISDVHITE